MFKAKNSFSVDLYNFTIFIIINLGPVLLEGGCFCMQAGLLSLKEHYMF